MVDKQPERATYLLTLNIQIICSKQINITEIKTLQQNYLSKLANWTHKQATDQTECTLDYTVFNYTRLQYITYSHNYLQVCKEVGNLQDKIHHFL